MTSHQNLHVCPACKCQFVQPFVCTTCGAQRLYDETVRSQAATIERLVDELRRLRKQMAEIAVLLLQNDRDEVMQWARGVKLTFPDGEPELAAVEPPTGKHNPAHPEGSCLLGGPCSHMESTTPPSVTNNSETLVNRAEKAKK